MNTKRYLAVLCALSIASSCYAAEAIETAPKIVNFFRMTGDLTDLFASMKRRYAFPSLKTEGGSTICRPEDDPVGFVYTAEMQGFIDALLADSDLQNAESKEQGVILGILASFLVESA